MAAADAFVLASHRESFGFAPVEAMLSGRAGPGRAARQRALSRFTVATMAEKVDGVYAEVASSSGQAS